jgi:hypothetical protein
MKIFTEVKRTTCILVAILPRIRVSIQTFIPALYKFEHPFSMVVKYCTTGFLQYILVLESFP